KQTNNELINSMLLKLNLKAFEHYYPSQISGGMKQKAALLFCLVGEPNILLMDEPFSALDYKSKQEIEELLLTYKKKTNLTIILVSHLQEELQKLCERIITI
ncbi:ATP-binding cassette domain-containing protein, partial [Staphylococcus saprophyticus]|uniref:ATP-binding cassette domain-containing protein n=1 Tax=Staphylococcus saprophyticus TaxID=29385 RepID=UPI000E68054A